MNMIQFTHIIAESKITAYFSYDKKFVADMSKFRQVSNNGLVYEMPANDFNVKKMNDLKDMYEMRGVNLVSIEIK